MNYMRGIEWRKRTNDQMNNADEREKKKAHLYMDVYEKAFAKWQTTFHFHVLNCWMLNLIVTHSHIMEAKSSNSSRSHMWNAPPETESSWRRHSSVCFPFGALNGSGVAEDDGDNDKEHDGFGGRRSIEDFIRFIVVIYIQHTTAILMGAEKYSLHFTFHQKMKFASEISFFSFFLPRSSCC